MRVTLALLYAQPIFEVYRRLVSEFSKTDLEIARPLASRNILNKFEFRTINAFPLLS